MTNRSRVVLVLLLQIWHILRSYSTSYSEAFFGSNETGTERYLIITVYRLGLANRLRTIADWHTIAIQSNRTLLVSWEKSDDCNANFHELFNGVPQGMRVLPIPVEGRNSEEKVKFIREIAIMSNISFACIDENLFTKNQSYFIMSDSEVLSPSFKIVMSTYDGLLVLTNMPCHQYIIKHSQFLSRLKPSNYIQETVDEVVNNYFNDSIMIGIHFRGHDSRYDWAVVPPMLSTEANKFGEGATIEDFANTMLKLQNKLSYYRSDGTLIRSCRFFIAANKFEYKQQLLELFPNSVALVGSQDRDTSIGVEFALIEWYLLSKSALILNTHGSSFAEEASLVNLVPLIGIWEGYVIHTMSLYHPYCGHKLFYTSYNKAKLVHGSDYSEGDVRMVKSIQITMLPCRHMAEWGLEVVYCLQN
eukprot:gene6530-8972_t